MSKRSRPEPVFARVVGAGLIGLVVAAGATACGSSRMGQNNGDMTSTLSPSSASYQSNGERIYFTATSASGTAISYQAGPGSPFGGTMMHLACSMCHGLQGHGGVVTMYAQTFEAPDISWAALTGLHEDNQPYTDATVKQAIIAGVDPTGQALDSKMPRWSMASPDADDLVAYLHTLK